MWLGHVPWAGRHWALPALTVLAPSTRYYQQQGRQHKKLTDWARQMVMQLRRWLPHRPLVLVGDNSYAVLDLLHCCQSLREPVTLIARLRLDAALYAPAPPPSTWPERSPAIEGPAAAAAESFPCADGCNLGQRRGGLVRRHHPRRGTHLPDGGLVPLRQAPRPHSLGADPRPPGLLRHSGPALYRPGGGPDPDPGMVCTALATGGHLPRGTNPIWVWRHNASGPISPSPAPRPPYWDSSPGPPWPPTRCRNGAP